MADLLPLSPVQELRRGGRPLGAINYSGISLLSKEFKAQGVLWLTELVRAYKAYQAETLALTQEQRAGGMTPDATLLRFWTEALPYLSLKMSEKITRGMKPKRPKKAGYVSKATLDALKREEGRA